MQNLLKLTRRTNPPRCCQKQLTNALSDLPAAALAKAGERMMVVVEHQNALV